MFYEKVPFQWLTFIGIEGVGGGGGVRSNLSKGFALTHFWLRTLTHVNFNHVSKIEARYYCKC